MKDTQVSMCQPATRGILFDALCAMHESGRSSLQGTPEQLSRVLRCSPPDLCTALQDLRQTGAVDVRDNGHGLVTITSRRMERDLRERTNATNRKRKERGQSPVELPGPIAVTSLSRDSHRDISEVRSQKSDAQTAREDSEVPDRKQALAQAANQGIPEDFADYVFDDWFTREGKDAGGVAVTFPRYVKRRWTREGQQWATGTHKGKSGSNGHAHPNGTKARAPDATAMPAGFGAWFQATYPAARITISDAFDNATYRQQFQLENKTP